jgi:hypothetical protein
MSFCLLRAKANLLISPFLVVGLIYHITIADLLAIRAPGMRENSVWRNVIFEELFETEVVIVIDVKEAH